MSNRRGPSAVCMVHWNWRSRETAASGCRAGRPSTPRLRRARRVGRHGWGRAEAPAGNRRSAAASAAAFGTSEVKGHVQPLGGHVDCPVRQPQPYVDLRIGAWSSGTLGAMRRRPMPSGVETKIVPRAFRVAQETSASVESIASCTFAGQPPVSDRPQRLRGALEPADAQMLFRFRDPRRGDGGEGPLIARRAANAAPGPRHGPTRAGVSDSRNLKVIRHLVT